jgi:hypothetical protein
VRLRRSWLVKALLVLPCACSEELLNLGDSDPRNHGGANRDDYPAIGGSAGVASAASGGTLEGDARAGVGAGGIGGAGAAGGTGDSSSGASGTRADASVEAGAAGGVQGSGATAGSAGTSAGAGGSDGACASSECPVRLAYQEGAPVKVAVDGEHVYWMTEGVLSEGRRGKLYKTSKRGGVAEILWQGPGPDLRALFVDDSHVYFASTPSLHAVPKSGGSPVTLFDGNLGGNPFRDEPWGVAMTSEHLYWATKDLEGGVRRIAKTGGAFTDLIVEDKGASVLATADGYLYWTTWVDSVHPALYRASLPDGMPNPIAPIARYVADLVITGRHVFAAGDGVVRLALDGTPPVTLSTAWSRSIESDGQFVYWAEDDGVSAGAIRRAHVEENVSTLLVGGLPIPLDMTMDSTSVYWLEWRPDDPDAGSVMKFAK